MCAGVWMRVAGVQIDRYVCRLQCVEAGKDNMFGDPQVLAFISIVLEKKYTRGKHYVQPFKWFISMLCLICLINEWQDDS